MSISDRRRNRDGQYRNESYQLSSLSRYDVILAFIPVVFALAILVAGALSVSLRTALAGASLIGAVGIVDVLFLHPPNYGHGR